MLRLLCVPCFKGLRSATFNSILLYTRCTLHTESPSYYPVFVVIGQSDTRPRLSYIDAVPWVYSFVTLQGAQSRTPFVTDIVGALGGNRHMGFGVGVLIVEYVT